jgi:hypothetical protein
MLLKRWYCNVIKDCLIYLDAPPGHINGVAANRWIILKIPFLGRWDISINVRSAAEAMHLLLEAIIYCAFDICSFCRRISKMQ